MDTEESEIDAMYIAESAITLNKNKEIRDVLVAALALAIETYKDMACKNQREICANTLGEYYFIDRDSYERGIDHIRNATEQIEDNTPESKLLIRELEELLNYGFERSQREGAADIGNDIEYVKVLDGVRWGVHVEDASAGEKKVVITKGVVPVRYCDTMETMTEKLIEYNLLK